MRSIKFWLLCLLATLLLASVSAAKEASTTAPLGNWKPLRTGGGGWMTGLHIHPSGNPVFARSDVGSAYRWNELARTWTNVVTARSMPREDVHWSKHSGVLSIVSAPSDAQVAYLAYQDCVYRSSDAGDHWTRTNLSALPMKPNDDSSKLSGERLSVDPVNPDIVYFGSINDGLWRTDDGGESWLRVAAIPKGAKERGTRQVLFDKATSADGKTRRVLAMVDGEDVFESTDAGATWRNANIGAAKPQFYDAEITSDGTLCVCGVDGQGRTLHVQRYAGKTWTSIFAATGHAIGEIALDPFDKNRAVLMTHGFNETYVCRDLLSARPAWNKLTYDRKAENIPWLAWTEGNWFSLGEVVFDPNVKNRLWIAEGTGIWMTSDLNDGNVTWEEVTGGQEHLVSSDIVSLPDDRTISAHWDRPLFLHTNQDEYPKTHQPSQRFNSGWALDRNPDDPEFVVAIVEDHRYCCYDDGQHRSSGFSTDGGKTWTRFASHPTFRGKDSIHGQIVVSATNRDNIVWLPVWNSMPYFTTDRGNSWRKSELPGHSGNCCIAAPWFQRECLAADRVLASTFYIYDWAAGHFFRSSDGGKSWDRSEAVLPQWSYHAKLRSVHGRSGHLWFAPGQQESLAAIGSLMRSIDGGKSWTKLKNTTEVLNVALGMAGPDATYATIFIQGRVNGEFGYFRSSDEGATRKKIGTYPLGIYDVAKVMHADPWRHDRLYVGFGGNGFVYYHGADAAR